MRLELANIGTRRDDRQCNTEGNESQLGEAGVTCLLYGVMATVARALGRRKGGIKIESMVEWL